MRPLLCLALVLAVTAVWMNAGASEANGGDVHIGELSGTASVVVIIAGGALVALFIGLFAVRWKQTARSSEAKNGEDAGPDEEPESLNEE